MGLNRILLASLFMLVGVTSSAMAQENSVFDNIRWQKGPCVSSLGNQAEIRVPAGYVFANAADTKVLMEAMHNIPTGSEMGFVAPSTLDWFLVFEYSDSGYIKDDEKSSLDADAMMKSIKAGNEAGNKEKAKRGWETMEMLGWQLPPRYNTQTHNLEWATKFSAKGDVTVNWNTRLLGRSGVMSVTLVSGEDKLQEILPDHNALLSGFSSKSGNRYAEFRQGDKIAKYGLTALVVGGEAAAAANLGLFKYIGKFAILIFVAVAAFFKSLWDKITNKKQ